MRKGREERKEGSAWKGKGIGECSRPPPPFAKIVESLISFIFCTPQFTARDLSIHTGPTRATSTKTHNETLEGEGGEDKLT